MHLEKIMKHETAGDPVGGCKWSRKSTYQIARQLNHLGIQVSAGTVGRLLKAQDYSLRVNRKSLESNSGKAPDPHRRDRQFHYIRRQRRTYETRDLPVISVDTKSGELIGCFFQSGQRWSSELLPVFDHDFPSQAMGVGIPYGIYDAGRNEGFVAVGTNSDTSAFAVDSIRTWWLQIGHHHYPEADEILLLADCGGSNGYRTRLWKQQLQERFCNPLGLKVRVAHYPPGASKWNPIEHRLFSFISANWAAEPLVSYQTMLNFIRTTRIEEGLLERYSGAYAILVNRVNSYSHNHDSMAKIAELQNVVAIAIVVYTDTAGVAAQLHRIYMDNVRVFKDRTTATTWLREAITKCI